MSFIQNFKSMLGVGVEADLDQRIFVERAHRIVLLRPQDLVCRLEYKGEPLQILIRDVSESGIGFRAEHFPQAEVGERLNAYVMAKGEAFAAELEITRRSQAVIGARVLVSSDAWAQFLKRHFELELEAGRLHLVDHAIIRKAPLGQSWWFVSPQSMELFFAVEGDRVSQFQFVFNGHYYEGDQAGFRYFPVSPGQRVTLKDQRPFVESNQHGEGPLGEARRFVSNIERLPSEYLNQILLALEK